MKAMSESGLTSEWSFERLTRPNGGQQADTVVKAKLIIASPHLEGNDWG